ncbi:MAG TPA: D-alanyl-D-alanine carboxypeptidase [Candidatus Coprovivens excrementavium]|nr:D-alanyl-D-alanine carboxypeptidase [Candidatus Coprovivens excrementavium]
MKKIIFLFLIIFLPFIKVNALTLPTEVDITADAIVLLNLDEDEIIYTKNPDKKEILASLTKIMTAYTVLQHVDDLDKKITVTEKDIANLYGFTCAGLEKGDRVSYLDLLYGTMLISGADASQTLAIHVGGSIDGFTKLMNEEAKKLGLTNSHFADSYGGDDNNVSTAREMAYLLKTALENKTFKKIFSTNYYTMSNGLRVVNYTASLATFHGLDSELLTGNKSGFTPEAGLLLASTATINGTNYALIVCKSTINEYKSTHVLDTYKIYNYISNLTFNKYSLLKKGTILKRIEVENGTISEYVVTADKEITAILTPKDYENLEYKINITDKITPENKIGDNLGYVDILVNGELVDTYHVYLKDEIFKYQKESKVAIIAIILLIFISLILLCTNILTINKRKF